MIFVLYLLASLLGAENLGVEGYSSCHPSSISRTCTCSFSFFDGGGGWKEG